MTGGQPLPGSLQLTSGYGCQNDSKMEAAPGLEPGNEGFAGLCLTNLAMPPHKRALYLSIRNNVKQNTASQSQKMHCHLPE